MGWEYHERKRDEAGKFARRDPEGGSPTMPITLRLPVDVVQRMRQDASAHHCEYGRYVTAALRAFWKAPRLIGPFLREPRD